MLVIVLIVIWGVVFALWSRMKQRGPEPPAYPGSLPLLGHIHLVFKDFRRLWEFEQEVCQYCTDKGGVIRGSMGPQTVYVITDPEDSMTIANMCLDKPYLYGFGKELFGRGLVTANATTWKPHRKLLNPAFNQQVLYSIMDEYRAHAKTLVSDLAAHVGKGSFDVQPYFSKSLLKTLCHTTLGLKNDNDCSTIIEDYCHATEGIFSLYHDRFRKFWLHIPIIFNLSPLKAKEVEFMSTLKDITENVIYERKSKMKENGVICNGLHSTREKFKPLLDQMLDLASKHDAFTDEEIREHLVTIVAATFDTTSISMTFSLILLGSHPKVQEKVFKELQEVFENGEKPINKHDLPRLVYLDAVIKESLRLYPPTPRIARSSSSPPKLKNYTLEADAIYILYVLGINRHPVWGADADQFKPERWLDPASLPENPNAFASFSLGRRNCIGKLYAMMVMKTTLAHILLQYRITANINDVKTICGLMLKPVAGHHISLELRT